MTPPVRKVASRPRAPSSSADTSLKPQCDLKTEQLRAKVQKVLQDDVYLPPCTKLSLLTDGAVQALYKRGLYERRTLQIDPSTGDIFLASEPDETKAIPDSAPLDLFAPKLLGTLLDPGKIEKVRELICEAYPETQSCQIFFPPLSPLPTSLNFSPKK